jgi:hypothetical protein
MYDFRAPMAYFMALMAYLVAKPTLNVSELQKKIKMQEATYNEHTGMYKIALARQVALEKEAMLKVLELEKKPAKHVIDLVAPMQAALKVLEKKLASKDVVIEYLTTTSVSDYILIFIWIVVGMVLGVFHELATNVTAYIGYEIIITAMYIVRQVILALVYVLQICLEEVSDF